MSPIETRDPIYIVHLDPVERRDTNHIGQVDLAPFDLAGQIEQVWLHDLGDGTYALACIPFMSLGLALGDVVRLSQDGKIAALVEARGHRVLRLMLVDSPDSTRLACDVDEITACIAHDGLLSEWHGRRFVAVDVSPAERPENVYKEGYSADPIEVQSNYCRDGHSEGFERATIVGTHYLPVLEVRNYLLDHPADLVDPAVKFPLPV